MKRFEGVFAANLVYWQHMRTIERDIAGAFLLSNDGFILLGKNVKGGVFEDRWVVPGGGIDEGESPEQAMQREILEEVGIDVTGAEIVEQLDYQTGASEKTLRDTGERVIVNMTFKDFVVTIDKPAKEITVILEDDFEFAEWTPIDELADRSYSPSVEYRLKTMGLLR